jgi:Ca2+-binding RTX toxin-like protein
MLHITRRRSSSLLVATATLFGAAVAVSAHAAALPGTVTSNSTDGMVYRANSDTTTIRVSLAGDRFTVDDSVALKAGAGCQAVAGDPTKATCTAPSSFGVLKTFKVFAGAGNDTVFNFTTVGMEADGGIGNDTLHGSVTARDDLKGSVDNDKLVGNGGNDSLSGGSGIDALIGGPGRDFLHGGSENDTLEAGDGDLELLDGGKGADILDGGPGAHDGVTYEFRKNSINAMIGSTTSGELDEGDEIRITVEDLRGGEGDDILTGSDADNTLEGFTGDDVLIGKRGADLLTGSTGDDALFSNNLDLNFPPLLATEDGAKDRLFGQDDTDLCDESALDGDFQSPTCES